MADDKQTNFKAAKEIGQKGISFSMARVPESGRYYFGTSDFSVYDVDHLAEKPEPKAFEGEGHQSYVMGVALTKKHVVTGGWDRHLVWWDRETGKPVRRQKAHAKWLRGVEVSPDGKRIISVGDDMIARVWDAVSGKLLHELEGHAKQTPTHYPSMLFCTGFSPDGQLLATGDKLGHVIIRETKTFKPVKTLDAPGHYTWDPRARRHSIGGLRSLRFSSDGKQLYTGGIEKIGNVDHLGASGRLEIFDWEKGESLKVIKNGGSFKGLVEHIEFAPNGKWAVLGGGDHGGWLVFVDTQEMKITRELKAPMHIHEFSLNEAADKIYAVGHDKLVRFDLQA